MTPRLVKFVGSKLGILAAHPAQFPVPDYGCPVAVPFVGGGSVAACYASRGHRVIASDINARLVNAHEEIRRDPEAVIAILGRLVGEHRDTLIAAGDGEEHVAGRAFFESERARLDEGGDALMAARFLFVIRAGFNGLYRENAAGECTTAYGKPGANVDLVQADKLRAYSAAVQTVRFLHEDFAVTCARARGGWAVVCDAPYEGTFTDYCGGEWRASQPGLPGMATGNDRERLAAMLVYLDAIGARWTNHDADTSTTRSLYSRWPVVEVRRQGTVNSDAEGRGDVTELLWRNWR